MTTLYQNSQTSARVRHFALRYLDVVIVVAGAIVATALGAPAIGCLIGATTWIVQRMLGWFDQRRIARIEDSLQRAGYSALEGFGRIFVMVAGIVLAAVIGNHKDGLAAAVVVLVGYSVAFVLKVVDNISRSSEVTSNR